MNFDFMAGAMKRCQVQHENVTADTAYWAMQVTDRYVESDRQEHCQFRRNKTI